MLIRAVIGNLYSFREKTEFNMLTGKVRTHPHHVHKLGKVEVVRTAAIYGANGAGKSNLVKALDLLQNAAISERIPNEKINSFKLGAIANLPNPYIEVEINIGKKNYLYGLELAHDRVVEEWLYESGLGEKPDTVIFERKTDEKRETKITFAPKYESTAKEKLRKELYESEILKPQTTLLWQLKKSGIKESKLVINWFESNLMVVFAEAKPIHLMSEFLENEGFTKFLFEMVPSLDTGVKGFAIISSQFKSEDEKDIEVYKQLNNQFIDYPEGMPVIIGREKGDTPSVIVREDGKLVKKSLGTIHTVMKDLTEDPIVFTFDIESDGTKKIIDHLLIVYEIIKNEVVFIIDEIERSIHPALIKTILQKLMAEKDVKGQLIFTTHESNLLDLSMLRPDEIWFAEKNEIGATSFYPLSDYQVRPDLDIEKGYLMGRFGGIPMLTDLKKLNWHNLTHAQN